MAVDMLLGLSKSTGDVPELDIDDKRSEEAGDEAIDDAVECSCFILVKCSSLCD